MIKKIIMLVLSLGLALFAIVNRFPGDWLVCMVGGWLAGGYAADIVELKKSKTK